MTIAIICILAAIILIIILNKNSSAIKKDDGTIPNLAPQKTQKDEAFLIDNTIEDMEKDVSPDEALEIIRNAKRNNEHLGSEYSYYANIAGKPFETQMISELNNLNPIDIHIWLNKKEKREEFLTLKVWKLSRTLLDNAAQIYSEIGDEFQRARKLELEEHFDDAIIAYEDICTRYKLSSDTYKRLVILYRKNKDYENELRICNDAIKYLRIDDTKRDFYKERMIKIKQKIKKSDNNVV